MIQRAGILFDHLPEGQFDPMLGLSTGASVIFGASGGVMVAALRTVVEKLTRRKLNPKYEGWLHAAGMVALLGLMVYVTFQDVFRIIGG